MTYLLIALATVAYAGSVIAFGRGPLLMNSNIFASIVNFLATLVPLALFVLLGQQHRQLATDQKNGVLWAVFGGLCIGVFAITLGYVFSTGKNMSFVTPLVFGGAIILASLAGFTLYQEKVMPLHMAGLLLIVTGILFIVLSSWKSGGVI